MNDKYNHDFYKFSIIILHFNDLNGHSKPFEYLESYLVWIMQVEMARISVSFV